MTKEQELILKELEVMKKENKELKKTLGELFTDFKELVGFSEPSIKE